MKPVLTDISGTIKQLLKERNETVEHLAEYLTIQPNVLHQKLDSIVHRNKFTVLQLEELADFFDCELHINLVYNNDKIYHCKTKDEVLEDGMNQVPSLFSNTENM